MTCPEARKLLYDREVSRHYTDGEERTTLLSLAHAHLLVCLACNEYFELERAMVGAVRDRVAALGAPMPAYVLSKTLQSVHDERMSRHERGLGRFTIGGRRSIWHRIASFFQRR